MFTRTRRTVNNGWPHGMPFAIIWLIAGTVMLSAISCSGGVSDAEFNAVIKDLETEKTNSQALQSDLARERADTARLVEAVNRFEGRIAELESLLSKGRTAIDRSQDSAHKAEAEAALLAAFLAWNRKDREGFAASFTNNGISETSLSVPANLGEPPIALRRLMDATVTGDTATIHAMFALGTQRHSVRYSMAKKAGVWKIDGEERLSPKVHGDTPVLDVKLDGCARVSDSVVMIDRMVAFKVRNSGQEHPLLILKRVPEDVDQGRLLQDDVTLSQGVGDVAFIRDTRAGEDINIAFTQPLQPGRYVLLCYPEEPGGIKRVAAEAIVATFMVK